MSNMLVLPEGHYLDDAETIISTTFVDVRDIGNRTPIAGLIKSSPEVHAIPRYGTVHVCSCSLSELLSRETKTDWDELVVDGNPSPDRIPPPSPGAQ